MNILSASGGVAEHGFTFIGHDVDGWTVALIAAGIAAVIYEVTMALTKAVTLRIPFLVLQIARVVTPEPVRDALYKKWKSDLWYILRGNGLWITKFVKGMWFALQLAIFGAVATARVVSPESARSRPAIYRRGLLVITSFATTTWVLGYVFVMLLDLQGWAMMLVYAGMGSVGVMSGIAVMKLIAAEVVSSEEAFHEDK